MGVDVQRHADVRMPHDILQRFGVHTALCHIGAEGMSAHMGRDLRKLYFVDFIVLGADMLTLREPLCDLGTARLLFLRTHTVLRENLRRTL